jgi:hypothetical protein
MSNSGTNNTPVVPTSKEHNVTSTHGDSSKNTSMYTATPLQLGIGLLIVGASAGMTLYTRKTQALLNQMKRIDENRALRLPRKKFGPPTKEEWEKLRSRWTDDDL